MLTKAISEHVSRLTNNLVTLCRNRRDLSINREEFRECKISWSQFGEDMLLATYFENLEHSSGVYVDVGAFSPIRLSNTLLLHKMGWSGINIDLDQRKIDEFVAARPRTMSVQPLLTGGGR